MKNENVILEFTVIYIDDSTTVKPGDRLIIKTPGGGGWGAQKMTAVRGGHFQ